jgi:regulator of replication initiation timing
MIYKPSDTEKICKTIQDSGCSFIRMVGPDGRQKKGYNQTTEKPTEYFVSKIQPYLQNPDFDGGIYRIEGKGGGRSEVQKILDIQKDGPETMKEPIISAASIKSAANFDLVQENAELKFEKLYLEKQLAEAELKIQDLESQIQEMESELAELEEQPAPALSENANLLMEFAKPLLPTIQAMAFAMMSKYLPQPENQLSANESPGTENN